MVLIRHVYYMHYNICTESLVIIYSIGATQFYGSIEVAVPGHTISVLSVMLYPGTTSPGFGALQQTVRVLSFQ